MSMNDDKVQQLVEQLSLEHFERPFLHKAFFNARLKTTGGRYLLHTHHIELNYKLYEVFGMEELKGIILHELCHYHMHIQGKGYKHRDADFKYWLSKVGAPRYCSVLPKQQRAIKVYRYSCDSCGLIYTRRRKVDVKKYKCGKCLGALYLIEMGLQ